MIVWRMLGLIVFLAGLSVLTRDVTHWFATKIWAPIALGQLWYELDRSSLNLAQAVIQRYGSPHSCGTGSSSTSCCAGPLPC